MASDVLPSIADVRGDPSDTLKYYPPPPYKTTAARLLQGLEQLDNSNVESKAGDPESSLVLSRLAEGSEVG